ncbi:hypothetical protein E2C01_040974 [Portunus trituberculatus]|uniref:Uncharacterized protein n=1 Tax=Portunus trituberculatus TaxID=210409 RepID=A0A5B7FQ76_PORTR|nr:hypothetical protein [Portunus trituberculatus]
MEGGLKDRKEDDVKEKEEKEEEEEYGRSCQRARKTDGGAGSRGEQAGAALEVNGRDRVYRQAEGGAGGTLGGPLTRHNRFTEEPRVSRNSSSDCADA